jgi:spermidine/putrescine ABC transporter ATP-binding subunit
MASVTLDHVSKVYGGTQALDGVNLSVHNGELVTLLGPSGCGKTTTLRLIAGFLNPTSGSIRIGDRDVTDQPPHRRALGMVFQSYALFPHLTIYENIGFGLREKSVPGPEIRQRVHRLLELIRLPSLAQRFPSELSGGQQQRVALARAIACEPKVLLMDEPLAALDLKLREIMQTEIRRIQRELGITTIYVTHDQTEAMRISDHIAVMNGGQIAQFGTPREIYDFPRSRFIADFVGKINLIPARLIERRANGIKVAIGDQVLEVEGNNNVAQDGDVFIGVRPEDMKIIATPQGPFEENENWMRGAVESSTFIGNTCEIRVRIADDLSLLIEAHPSAIASLTSDQVFISWRPDRTKILSR